MKIRNGFVSNSSSSSFVILGERVDINNVPVDDLENDKYTYVASTGLSYEASIFVEIHDVKMLDVLKTAKLGGFNHRYLDSDDIEVYKSYFHSYDWSDADIESKKLPKTFRVFQFTADQCSFLYNSIELEKKYSQEDYI